jgi:hypothetical protein
MKKAGPVAIGCWPQFGVNMNRPFPEPPDKPRTLAEVRQLAADLLKCGMAPYDICLRLGTELAKAGIASPTALALMRELPGLEAYDVLADYTQRTKAAAAEDPHLACGIDGNYCGPDCPYRPDDPPPKPKPKPKPPPFVTPLQARQIAEDSARDVMAEDLPEAHRLLHEEDRKGGKQ